MSQLKLDLLAERLCTFVKSLYCILWLFLVHYVSTYVSTVGLQKVILFCFIKVFHVKSLAAIWATWATWKQLSKVITGGFDFPSVTPLALNLQGSL